MFNKIKSSNVVNEFGLKYAMSLNLLRYLKKFYFFNYKKHYFRLVCSYLKKHYKKHISKADKAADDTHDFKVFVCWWQGIDENTPEIVSACISSIKEHFHNHVVVVIDKYNYSQYTTIPNFIIEKMKKGIISLTHFSDILRMCLLSDNGGCWLDATCFLGESIEEELENNYFYTNKLDSVSNPSYLQYVSRGRWSGFFLRDVKKGVIVTSVKQMLIAYWKEHNTQIDYYLIDYLICVVYEGCKEAKTQIDNVPINNNDIHLLFQLLPTKFDERKYLSILKNTKIFKLNHKIEVINKSEDTFYHKLIVETDE